MGRSLHGTALVPTSIGTSKGAFEITSGVLLGGPVHFITNERVGTVKVGIGSRENGRVFSPVLLPTSGCSGTLGRGTHGARQEAESARGTVAQKASRVEMV